VLQVNLGAMAARQRLYTIKEEEAHGVQTLRGVKLVLTYGKRKASLFTLPEAWVMSDGLVEAVFYEVLHKLSAACAISQDLLQGECERR